MEAAFRHVLILVMQSSPEFGTWHYLIHNNIYQAVRGSYAQQYHYCFALIWIGYITISNESSEDFPLLFVSIPIIWLQVIFLVHPSSSQHERHCLWRYRSSLFFKLSSLLMSSSPMLFVISCKLISWRFVTHKPHICKFFSTDNT